MEPSSDKRSVDCKGLSYQDRQRPIRTTKLCAVLKSLDCKGLRNPNVEVLVRNNKLSLRAGGGVHLGMDVVDVAAWESRRDDGLMDAATSTPGSCTTAAVCKVTSPCTWVHRGCSRPGFLWQLRRPQLWVRGVLGSTAGRGLGQETLAVAVQSLGDELQKFDSVLKLPDSLRVWTNGRPLSLKPSQSRSTTLPSSCVWKSFRSRPRRRSMSACSSSMAD